MRVRELIVAAAFLGTYLLAPSSFVGCGDLEDGFEYEAVEMAGLVEGANGLYVATHPTGVYHITIAVRPKPAAKAARWWSLGNVASACANRTVFASASACMDSSTMRVEGTVMLQREGADEQEVEPILDGELVVMGLRLQSAHLELRLARGALTLASADARTFTVEQLTLSVD